MHIDPPQGKQIVIFERALSQFPDTTMIFAHGNVYNTPGMLKGLLERHPNLYIDFFPAFHLYNKDNTVPLADFIPVIQAFPNKFFLSMDSGFAMTEEQALEAMYRTLELIKDEDLIRKVAGGNFMRLMELQPATATQKEQLRKKINFRELNFDMDTLAKMKAHELLRKYEW